jgi:hypothetical protein
MPAMPGSVRLFAAIALVAASLLSPAASAGDASDKPSAAVAEVLPRDTVVPRRTVAASFPNVTVEAGVGPNETTVGDAAGSISVVFTDPGGTKKVTLSVDAYASTDAAASAFRSAIAASEAAPGFRPSDSPGLGEEAFAGTSQVGAEMHYGLGARDGRLIVSATHAGDIPVTPANAASLADLAGATLAAAKRVLGP